MADVTIYTTGDRTHGLGHVVRMRLLAGLLVERGASVRFVTTPVTPGWDWLVGDTRWTVTDCLPDYEHGCVGIIDVEHGPSSEDLAQMKRSFDSVVTVYGGHSFALKEPDLVEALSDLVLCQSLFEFPRPAHVLQGTKYLLLDPAYAQCVPSRAGPIVVCMGGADPHGLTLPALNALADIGRPVIAFVGSAAAPITGRLPANALVVCDASSLVQYLNGAALLVGALGMVAYEALAAGVPCVLYSWSENHKATADELWKRGVGDSLGLWSDFKPQRLTQATEVLLQNSYAWNANSHRARQLVDGQGAARCADAIMGLLR